MFFFNLIKNLFESNQSIESECIKAIETLKDLNGLYMEGRYIYVGFHTLQNVELCDSEPLDYIINSKNHVIINQMLFLSIDYLFTALMSYNNILILQHIPFLDTFC